MANSSHNDNRQQPEIVPFDFHGRQVRVATTDDGDPRFVLNDLCAVLEIGNARQVRARLDEECVSQADVLDGRGLLRPTTVVDEAGMYEVILRSDKPEAVEFRRWVTREVLPSIRKHGGYLTPDKAEQILTDPDTIIRLATDLKTERERRAQLEQQATIDAPKVLFADAVSTAKTDILVGDLAKILRGNGVDIGANRLFAVLREKGYLSRRKGTDWNMPTQRSMDLELFKIKETTVVHSDGHTSINKTPKVTGKGQLYFVERFLDGRIDAQGGAA
ncbi:phage antirepressor KilAC domain-containing protein [Corynebacterium sp.]|uniref:phage antirepressor n=1 Tax=Corynebacterium sp. TaxID=1720 RepID=UPI0028AB8C5C|nr:phage antirepressor KilAC domain-containing protein [Corynebacterium sp.]